MNRFLNLTARPDRFLKPVRSLLLLMLLIFCTAAFATPTTPTTDFIDNGDGTVTHKLTGLVWMRCSMGQTWDKATSNCTGTAATYTWDAAIALKSNFAGKSDWRLPNIAELQTIVDRENFNPAMNTTVFPNTPNNWAWSSSLYASNSYAWGVDFYRGNDNGGYKDYSGIVRLVRGGLGSFSLTTPAADFTDNNDGTVTHKRTGLMWQRCSVGQIWTGSTCSGTANTYTYANAIALTSTFTSKNDWRVPNQNELSSIIEYGSYNPAINSIIFPNTPNSWMWSSSPSANADYAWAVQFFNGNIDYTGKDNNIGFVRLVRGQWTGSFASNLDMTNPNCRYVAPIYSAMWQLMKVKQAPSCGAVLKYHTWRNFTYQENIVATQYNINRLANIDTSNQIFNARLALIDNGISVLNDVLDPDLKSAVSNGVLSSSGYKLSTNIMKSKGIVASLAAGQSPFNLSTTAGKLLNKTLKDKIIIEGGSKVLCNLFLDSAAAQSCSDAAAKVSGCVTGLDWQSKAMCVKDGVFSYVTVINNAVDIFDVIKITKNLNGYMLINDYLENYYLTLRSQRILQFLQLSESLLNSLNVKPLFQSKMIQLSGYFKALQLNVSIKRIEKMISLGGAGLSWGFCQ